MDVDGREAAEDELYRKGPLSVLTSSVKTNSMVRSAAEPFAIPALRRTTVRYDARVRSGIACAALSSSLCMMDARCESCGGVCCDEHSFR